MKDRVALFLSRRRDLAIAFMVFASLASVLYLPVFSGYVPFPHQIVTFFAPWRPAPVDDAALRPQIADLAAQMYPWRKYAAESVAQGVLPYWNTHVLGGAPFVANAQSALFYPPNLVYHLFPVPLAWSLTFVLHVFLAGLLTTLFLRALGCHRYGALAGGMIYGLSGFATVWRGYPMGQAAVWLPLICWSVVLLRRELSPRAMTVAGIAFAMPVLAGHPETAIHVTIVGLLLAVWEWLFRDTRGAADSRYGRILFPGLVAGAGTLSLAISAAQLLPTVEWVMQGTHSLAWRWPPRPLSEALTFVTRDLSGATNITPILPEGAAYAGILTLLLASLAFFAGRPRYPVFFALLGTGALMQVYGIGPLYGVVEDLPVLAALKNWRVLFIAEFSLAVLAAFGISSLLDAPPPEEKGLRRFRKVEAVVGATVAALLVAAYMASNIMPEGNELVVISVIMFIVGGGVLLFLRTRGLLRSFQFGVACCLLLAVDMVPFGFGYIPFTKPENIFPPSPLFEFLQSEKNGDQDRVAGVDTTYPVNTEMMYGLRSPTGYDNVMARTRILLEDLTAIRQGPFEFSASSVAANEDRRLDILNVRYLVAAAESPASAALAARTERYRPIFGNDHFVVFENLLALPAAFLVPADGVEIYKSEATTLKRLRDPDLDPLRTALLAVAPEFAGPRTSLPATDAEVLRLDRDINRIRITAQAQSRSILILSEMHYPGWRVQVNGVESQLLETNYALMGVALEPGRHDIEFAFEPHIQRIGILLTLLGILVATVLVSSRRLPESTAGILEAHRRRAPLLITGALVLAALVVTSSMAALLSPPRDDVYTLEVFPDRVTAGEDSYQIIVTGAAETAVPIRYTLNDGPVELWEAHLDAGGRMRVDVPDETARGVYRFLEFKVPNVEEWIETEAVIWVE